MPIDFNELGQYMSELNIDEICERFQKNQVSLWLQDPTTKAFIDLIVESRMNCMNLMADITMNSQDDVVNFSELKGGFEQLGALIEIINYTRKGDNFEEDT